VTGEGPIELAWQFDWFGNVDVVCEDSAWNKFYTNLARYFRLILHDHRATRLSSRNVSVPNLETRVADLASVLDAVDSSVP
jgi:hypothetical protein